MTMWDCQSCGTRNIADESCPYCGAERATKSNASQLKFAPLPEDPKADTISSRESEIPGCLAIFAMIGFMVTAFGGNAATGPISKFTWYVYAVVGIIVVLTGLVLLSSLLGQR